MIKKDIVIIGAGLTGLTTSYYLNSKNKDFIVIEKKDKVGGVIQTNSELGYTYETGPNTGVIGNYEVVELFENLKIFSNIETPGKEVKKRYILKHGKWRPLPMGIISAIFTPLFKFKDKIRILGEPFRSRNNNPNEDVASMVVRRLGKSFLDYAIDPFIAGVYSGNPKKLITRFAFPKLYKLEQDYGSLIIGGIKKQFEKKSANEKRVKRKVFSVKDGLSNLINLLYINSGTNNIILGAKNVNTEIINGKFVVSYTNSENEVIKIIANKLVTTTGAYTLESILSFIDRESILKIINLKYADVIEVILGFKEWDGINPDGFGGLVPSIENRDILGILFMSTLFKNRAPVDSTLFTIFLGGIRRPDLFSKTEKEIKKIIENEIMLLLKPSKFNPNIFKVFYHKNAIPQYDIDTETRLDIINNIEKKFEGLIIGGNVKDGIGMADRIKQGKKIANKLIEN